jgi:hypothetical protein
VVVNGIASHRIASQRSAAQRSAAQQVRLAKLIRNEELQERQMQRSIHHTIA